MEEYVSENDSNVVTTLLASCVPLHCTELQSARRGRCWAHIGTARQSYICFKNISHYWKYIHIFCYCGIFIYLFLSFETGSTRLITRAFCFPVICSRTSSKQYQSINQSILGSTAF